MAIYDWGQEDATYYIVMELIEGRTLREILKTEGALPPPAGGRDRRRCGAALTVAHQAGVVHRDIKPGNIMVTDDGAVKVTDFGIARALDDSEELTRTGAVIGTATYFSPEQAQGYRPTAAPTSTRSASCSTRCSTAQPPFTGREPRRRCLPARLRVPAPPPNQINPDVPADLSAIDETAIAKNPDDRYPTADDMRSDLLLFLSGRQPVIVGAAAAAAATSLVPPPATVPPDETARVVAYETEGRTTGQGTYVAAVIALLALLVVGVIILFRLFTGGAGDGDLVVVPDLTLVPAETAFQTLQDLDLKVTSRLENSDTVPQGVVIRTDPAAGSAVERGSFVSVFESAGVEQFTVPQVEGETEEVARALIEAQGFEVGLVEDTLTEDVPEGIVISQSPSSGTPAAAGSLVDLIVSRGPFSIEVPDVSGMSSEGAQLELAQSGFTNVVTETEFSAEIAEGFTIRTEPEAGRQVGRDDTITVFVSDGPEPATVPSLVGRSIGTATDLADEANLVLVDEGTVDVDARSAASSEWSPSRVRAPERPWTPALRSVSRLA